MYDGRFGEIECFVCEEEILSGDKEAFSLYNGRDLETAANAGSWVFGSDCNETYAEFWAESQIG